MVRPSIEKETQGIETSVALASVGLGFIWIWFSVWGWNGDKYWYNARHPYVSIFPIVGFLCLRNCHRILRQTHSSAMAWVGNITLETYVFQFHIFMCHNVKSILVFVPDMPVTNAVLVSVGFLSISVLTRYLTQEVLKFSGSILISTRMTPETSHVPLPTLPVVVVRSEIKVVGSRSKGDNIATVVND